MAFDDENQNFNIGYSSIKYLEDKDISKIRLNLLSIQNKIYEKNNPNNIRDLILVKIINNKMIYKFQKFNYQQKNIF